MKINCKGKWTVEKANKEINVEKIIIGLKDKKLKLREKKKKENTELQKPNVEVEVYNSNRKCDWGKKKRKLKSLIRSDFILPIKSTTATEERKNEK